MSIRSSPHIFVSVAEQSADEHAAKLVEAFRRRSPYAVFGGLAGPALQAAGCESMHDMTTRSAMALAAFRRIPEALRLLSRIKARLSTQRYDAAVLVDSPAINLPIAKLFKKRGIPVLYYIAPQTWAWGHKGWRNRRLRLRVDRLACIWPFEQPYFSAAGIPASYVGHPSFDRLIDTQFETARVEAFRRGAKPVLTLLPGSRRHVVEEVFPGQIEVAVAVAARFPASRFLVVAANDEIKRLIRTYFEDHNRPRVRGRDLPVEILDGQADKAAAIRAADLALVASGTVTLEVAYHGTPMIVMYNTERWAYHLLGRWLLTTPYLSIPNILAGRQIVPEFMPFYRTTDPITAQVVDWLSNPKSLERVRADLLETIRPLAKRGAAENAAKELEVLIQDRG